MSPPMFSRMRVSDALVDCAAEGMAFELAWSLDHGADPGSVSMMPGATSALTAASMSDAPASADCMLLLLVAGANPDGEPGEDAPPIARLAARGGAMAEAKGVMLAAWGADAGACDAEGRSALSWAVDRGLSDLAKALVVAGADPCHAAPWEPRPIDLCDPETAGALMALRRGPPRD